MVRALLALAVLVTACQGQRSAPVPAPDSAPPARPVAPDALPAETFEEIGLGGVGFPGGLALDEQNAYWASDAIFMVPRGGGEAVGLADRSAWTGLVLAGGRLVWVDSDTRSIDELELPSGKVRALAEQTNACSPLVVDDESVYYTVTNDWEAPSTLYSIPRAGGKPTKLAAGAGCVLAGDAVSLYTEWDGRVRARSKRGGAWRTLSEGIRGVRAIAVDNDALYVSAWGAEPGRIVKVPIAGGAPGDVATGQRRPDTIAVGATHVCWTTGVSADEGAVMCARKSGGPAVAIDEHQPGARWLAIGGGYVYWVVRDTKRIGVGVRRSRLAP